MENAQLTFEALVNAYSADLYRYAYWLTRDKHLAEDMVQETFMRAWKALHSLHDHKAAKYWLITILRREIARHFGKHRHDTVHYESDTELDQWLEVDHGPSAVEQWALHRALEEIPKDYLDPLLLQVLGGYSCDEIGELLGISGGAVMTRVCRARQKLRHVLEGETTQRTKKVPS
ncbi:MAG: sigma-70 family RNA polymerase sigma factor [Gammaproteobacteria bacterium]|nr:sigma-70 family RNA polymerase sigma factor [Gammaproteobacteria bacterium]